MEQEGEALLTEWTFEFASESGSITHVHPFGTANTQNVL